MSLEARTKREAEETEHQSRLEVQAMEAIRSVRVTGKMLVKVVAVGDEKHGGIQLVEFKPEPGCYRNGQTLCVEVKFLDPPGGSALQEWVKEKTFDGSADLRRAPVSASFGVLGPDGRAGS